MAMASKLDIPEKPKVVEPWTFKRLFPFKGTVSALAKNFTNPFDALLAFLILIIGIAELSGSQVSWMTYILTGFILIADVIERQKKILPIKKEKK